MGTTLPQKPARAVTKPDAPDVPAPAPLTPDEARAIAKEAYIYGFPLVDSYRIQHSYFVDRGGPEYKAPWNQLYNTARVYTPDDRAIQSPNSDTPYSFIGADLRAEPLVIDVPAVDPGRYYSLQFIDAYTFNFAYVGSRTTGNEAGTYLLAGPGWAGRTPAGIDAVLRSETDFAFVIFRTQLLRPDDLEHVKRVQAGYGLRTFSHFTGSEPPAPAPALSFPTPLTPQDEHTSLEFFRILSFVLQFCPVHPSETALRARLARLGIVAGSTFVTSSWSPEVREAVQRGVADAWKTFDEFKTTKIDTGRTTRGLTGTREALKNNYLYRMTAAVLGIYANSTEEALYPMYYVDAGGAKLDGTANRYVLRFTPGCLPPVSAFWSLTVYDLPGRLLVANPLNRYVINSSMLPALTSDDDGGLTLYLQHDPPGKEHEANWLPVPAGPFFAAMRLYWPRDPALNGSWKPPRLQRTNAEVQAAIPVTVETFERAESDRYFIAAVRDGGFGKFHHHRELMPIERQTVVRANRDTLYSSAVFDLEASPVTVTLPDAGKRFMSMEAIDEDQYAHAVVYGAGAYTISKEMIGTRYVLMAVRTFVDPSDPDDVARATALQDAIRVEQTNAGAFRVPPWDVASQKTVRDALLVLGRTLADTRRMFGRRDQVDPVRHLVGTATAWGGNPEKDALYLTVTPSENDGTTPYDLVVGEVPIDGFWSISVYDADGYFRKNEMGAYSLNGVTAERDANGTTTIRFGGADPKAPNYLPIAPGWNYTVRLYRPRAEVLDGSWHFPDAHPLDGARASASTAQ
jgi:hypothetical protein